MHSLQPSCTGAMARSEGSWTGRRPSAASVGPLLSPQPSVSSFSSHHCCDTPLARSPSTTCCAARHDNTHPIGASPSSSLRRMSSVAHASEAAIDTYTGGQFVPPVEPHRATHDTRGAAAPRQPVLKRMMSWLRDLALDSFNSYDEEDDAELLTPTTMLSSTRGQPARASATAAATDTIPPLVRPIHPSKAKKQQPQHNGSNGNTPHQQEPDSPRTRRLLEQLPTLCPLGAHDAAVSAYLENIGMTEESIVWARLNVPELFDMDVGTALKPGYKRLFDLPSPPSALVCQLKTVAALHYLADLGMVGGPVQQTTQGPGGATVTTTVDGSVYNAPAVEAVAVSGQLDGLYDLVDLHVKPLVGLLKESTLDVRTVVKVWGEMPTFFTSSYLPSITETTTFLSALGLEPTTVAAFVATVNPSGPPLHLEAKLSYLLDHAGLTRAQVAQLFREYPGIVTLGLESNVQPVIECMRRHPSAAGGLSQGEIMRLLTGHPALLGMPPATLQDLLEFLHTTLQDTSLTAAALAARKDAPLALNCSLAATAVRDVAEAFRSVGLDDGAVRGITRVFPGVWTCNVSGKRHGPKIQYWKEELGFAVPAMTECPMFLSYNLAKHVGPRVAALKAAQQELTPASLASLLAMEDGEFATQVCSASVEEWEAFKTSWQNSRDGRRWHCSADDIPGRSNGGMAMGGDGLAPTSKQPMLTRFNTFKLTPQDLPVVTRPPPSTGPLRGDGM